MGGTNKDALIQSSRAEEQHDWQKLKEEDDVIMRKAIDRISETKNEYERNRGKKWFCTGVLAVVGVFVGFTTPYAS